LTTKASDAATRPATYADQLAQRAAELLGDIDLDARLELLGAMTPEEMSTCLAFLASFAPAVFDASIVRDRQLAERLVERLDHQYDDDPQAYCTTCGALLGIFHGQQDKGWQHFRGEGTAASPVELYDAGHKAEVAWREAGADVVEATLPRVRCLRTVWTDGNPELCGLPVDHEPDEECPGNPHARPATGASREGGAQ